MKGVVFEIERWSLSDGPGTRTVVFLKGCPLRCQWCSNPESQSPKPQIGIFTAKCIGCEKCQEACPIDLARPAKSGGFGVGGTCLSCGECVESCPSRSRRWMGEEMTPEDVLKKIRKDMIFYRKSAGGVTFSGGEPLTQPIFLREILEGCRKLGIHTSVETCGAFNWAAAKDTVSLLDFVMFDLKHMNADHHTKYTGASNKKIMENAKKIAGLEIPMVIRIPVIPSFNDSTDNIRATAKFVRDHLPSAVGIEPLPYHKLGLTKYAALGLEYKLHHIESPSDTGMGKIQDLIRTQGVPVITVDSGYGPQPVQQQTNLDKHLNYN